MHPEIEAEIQESEEQLRLAMIASDVSELRHLLADDLTFININGKTIGKDDDIEAHESGRVKINSIKLKERQIKTGCGHAVVTVLSEIDGSFDNHPSTANIRFTRVWNYSNDLERWQVVSGQATLVV